MTKEQLGRLIFDALGNDDQLSISSANYDQIIVSHSDDNNKFVVTIENFAVRFGRTPLRDGQRRLRAVTKQILAVLRDDSAEPYNDLAELIVDNFDVPEFLEALGQRMKVKEFRKK